MAVNKVEVNGETVLDLSQDSVTPEQLVQGATAHNAAGEQITGTYTAPVTSVNGQTGDVVVKSAYASAQDGGYTGTEAAFNVALAQLENKADKSVSATTVLTAAGWSDGIQTLTVSAVTAAANGSLRIAQSATDEQFEAWGAAKPRVTAQAAGTLTVKAVGTVPTIDIPVEVVIV